MKRAKILCIVMVFAVVVSALSGCSLLKNKGGASSAPSSSEIGTSSQSVSSNVQSEVQSEAPSSGSSIAAGGNEPAESQPGQVIVIETDDKEFDKQFKLNPIDKKYIQDSNNAFSNLEMIQLSDKYGDIWSKEVTSAYNKLIKLAKDDALSKVKAEQTAWVNGKTEALKKISDAAQAAGGTMAQVNASSSMMDYYRTRAAQVYKELYAYDKNYTYGYKK